MTPWEALLYGSIQGLTEYLPVSSSAHLALAPLFMGKTDPGLAFDVFLHSGTLAATLIYFRKDWVEGWKGFTKGKVKDGYVSWQLIAAGTIPALAVGGLFHKVIERVFHGPATMALGLLFGGIALAAVDYKCRKTRTLHGLKMKDALIVGALQCFSLISGVSRSGSTMTAGRALGLNREAAARFSFLLSGPITAAAIVFEMRKYKELLQPGIGLECLLIGGLASFISGWLAIDVLLKVVRRYSFLPFVLYRAALAGVIWWVLLR